MSDLRLFSLVQAAREMGVSYDTLWRIARDEEEKFPIVIVRGQRRVPAALLARWIEEKGQQVRA